MRKWRVLSMWERKWDQGAMRQVGRGFGTQSSVWKLLPYWRNGGRFSYMNYVFEQQGIWEREWVGTNSFLGTSIQFAKGKRWW